VVLTGKQGGAVLDRLLDARGWKLIALSREPNGDSGSSIRELGVEVRQADRADRGQGSATFRGGGP
jgi:uncharacterized protein YbjT (DUF2867 family)